MVFIATFFGLCLLIFIVRKVFSGPPTASEVYDRLYAATRLYGDNPSYYSPSEIDKLLAETLYYAYAKGEYYNVDAVKKLYDELSALRDRDPTPSKVHAYLRRLEGK